MICNDLLRTKICVHSRLGHFLVEFVLKDNITDSRTTTFDYKFSLLSDVIDLQIVSLNFCLIENGNGKLFTKTCVLGEFFFT